jgi:UPF0755 protein
LTLDEIESVATSPYNTYKTPVSRRPPSRLPVMTPSSGDPPGEGNWYYYVTVNLKTGETKFYEDYNGFLAGKAEYQQYCTTSDAC